MFNDWSAEQLIIVLEEFGPENFGAVVSDNGGGCENGRKLTKEKYPHLAIQRCMMHGFALIMGSVFGHSWAVNILKQCQKLTAAVKIIKSKFFWRDLDILTPIAKPFNQVCQAMQGHESKLADAGRYLILLARTIKALGTAEPGYRVLGRNADGRDDFKVIGREAVEMLRACKRSQNEITIMLNRFKATTVGAMAETKSYLQLCPPENLAMYQPKQLRPTAAKATKKQRTLDEADAQPLDITETARWMS
ncbi:hypothetical protein WJX77_009087 [Trebouxia sp. C0004]